MGALHCPVIAHLPVWNISITEALLLKTSLISRNFNKTEGYFMCFNCILDATEKKPGSRVKNSVTLKWEKSGFEYIIIGEMADFDLIFSRISPFSCCISSLYTVLKVLQLLEKKEKILCIRLESKLLPLLECFNSQHLKKC